MNMAEANGIMHYRFLYKMVCLALSEFGVIKEGGITRVDCNY